MRAELLPALPASRPPRRAGRHLHEPRRIPLRRARARSTLTDAPSTTQIVQARLAVGLLVALVVGGALWYGLTAESLGRLWSDILDRPGGPMTFRFILQPAMAFFAAFRDGAEDAQRGRRPYLWAIITEPGERKGRIYGSIISTSRIILLGLFMDAVYQLIVLKTFYPGQAVIIALALALVPYVLMRGPIARIAHWSRRQRSV